MAGGTFGDEEKLAALRLARSAEIGPVTYRNLIERFGSAGAAIDALPSLAANGGRAGQIRIASLDAAQAELDAAARLGAELVVHGEPSYPALLKESEGAPAVLFVRGQMDCLERPALAIVGARNASANGRKLAEALAAGLGARGHVVVSGLARGIDGAAHRGALATGTIAVLAGGVDCVYPDMHGDLYEAITHSGAVVSEMPIGQIARAADFPRRNRIIAGLARGIIVVEAAERSGSLITARLAGEMGREVFAVPGSPLDARCRGTNRLIKDGATLVETVDDIVDALRALARAPLRAAPARPASRPMPRPAPKREAERTNTDSLAEQVLALLGPSPTAVDELMRQTGASAAQLQEALFDLELAGLALRHPGQAVSRVQAD